MLYRTCNSLFFVVKIFSYRENVRKFFTFTRILFYKEKFSDEHFGQVRTYSNGAVRVNCLIYRHGVNKSRSTSCWNQSIRRYLKPVSGLPNPRGSLSAILPSAAIASANHEVEKVLPIYLCTRGSL